MSLRKSIAVPFTAFLVVAAALAASGVSPQQKPAANQAASGNESQPADARLYLEAPLEKLKKAIPALNGISPAPNQNQLSSILDGMAETIAGVVPRLPDLVSHEEVYRAQTEYGPTTPRKMLSVSSAGGSLAPIITSQGARGEEFRYLIQCHRAQNGVVTLQESRTDFKGKPVNTMKNGTAQLGSGFAYQWLLFAAANQTEFEFRYLGEEDIDDRKTFVLAFAQVPEHVKMPAVFQSNGKQAPYFYQGILWVDQATSNIVLLRSDLLAPLKNLRLQQLTTELRFRSVTIHDVDASFWLPSEVRIEIDQENSVIDEEHQYTDYHLYHSTARILP
jgi:hypothetical protein